jgi:hypothetical protein
VNADRAARALPREDDTPWYRQFWPWFLIALPGTVVIAAIATLVIAVRHADDLVVDDYYRSGLAINQRLAAAHRAEELGLDARIQVFEDRVQLRLGGPDPGTALRLRLSHPLEADRDFSLQLERSAPGLYLGHMPGQVTPNWHWTLDAGETSSWRLDGELAAADFL